MTIKVKICGIKKVEDALFAAAAGADAVGLVFAPSPRRVNVEEARAVCAAMPPFVARVGIFVDEEKETVEQIARTCGLTALQFHGDEDAGYCQSFTLPVLKAIRVRAGQKPKGMDEFPAAAFIFDTYDPLLAGGTGRPFDWSLLGIKHRKPVIIAGGLTAENVGEAIRIARPYGVDVSGGVETGGEKDWDKISGFINAVRRHG